MSIPKISDLVNDGKFVYFLGFLWADGWISKRDNSIEIVIVESDFNELKDIFFNTINWNMYKKQRSVNKVSFGKPQIRINKSLPELKIFLLNNGYALKSGGSPKQILDKIPKDLHHYWWRGYFDGDGSIAISKNGCKNLSFWSVIDQEWEDLKNVMYSCQIKFNVYSYRRKCGCSSSLTVTNKNHILLFGKYIYPNLSYDFGLKRKFDKFLLL